MRRANGDELVFERVGADRYCCYVRRWAPNATSEYRNRVRHVGTIEKHAGKCFWYLRDDSDAGMTETLSEAMEAIEAHA